MSYHKFVFDTDKRAFVGDFDEMYRKEDHYGEDPWHSSDLTHIPKKIHQSILESYNFEKILDFGCGKGAFTHLLKKRNNKVLGVDISNNAIEKAQQMYGHLADFKTIEDGKIDFLMDQNFDLVVCLETLSYVEEWEKLIKDFSTITDYIYISLYIPQNPIGFVKTQSDLKEAVSSCFNVAEEIVYNQQSIFLLGTTK